MEEHTFNTYNLPRGSTCPVCGGPDYCSISERDDGMIFYNCKRFARANQALWKVISEYDTGIGHVTKVVDAATYDGNGKTFSGQGNYKPVSDDIEGCVPTASPDMLDAVYRDFLKMLVLEDKHKASLKNEWDAATDGSLFDRITAHYPIRSLAPNDFVRKKLNERFKNPTRFEIVKALSKKYEKLESVPGFYKNAKGYYGIAGTEGILFPIYDSQGRIIRLRLREDYPVMSAKDKEGHFVHGYSEDGIHQWVFYGEGEQKVVSSVPAGCKAQAKYKNFTSVYEKSEVRGEVRQRFNGYGLGSQSGSFISLYGKDCVAPVVYVTEGEKKAMVATSVLGVPVISVPGVGTFGKLLEKEQGSSFSMADVLKDRGINMLCIAYDADKAVNADVLKSEQKAAKALIEAGFKVAIAEWNQNWGKGLDDILVAGVKPSVFMVQ